MASGKSSTSLGPRVPQGPSSAGVTLDQRRPAVQGAGSGRPEFKSGSDTLELGDPGRVTRSLCLPQCPHL